MKVFYINPELCAGVDQFNKHQKTDSPLFKAIEEKFDQWISDSNPAMEYNEKYFGDNAILSKREAIRGAMYQIFGLMYDEKIAMLDLSDPMIDYDAAFSD